MYRSKNHERQNIFDRAIGAVILLITIAAAALLVLSYMGSYVNPNTFWPFAFLTLSLPFIFFANVIIMLYWILRWRWFFLIPLVVLLVGANDISAFFKPSLSKEYDNQDAVSGGLTLMSYNVAGFFHPVAEVDKKMVMDSTINYIKAMDADIICFQEFETNYINQKSRLDSLLGDWRYNRVSYSEGSTKSNGRGQAIYSKYPIVSDVETVHYPSGNGLIWVDILVDGDTIHLFNNHLQTMSVSKEERMMFDFAQNSESMETERVRSVAGKMRENFKLRANQVDTMATVIGRYDRRVVVCGDFNDTPFSYTYRTMRGDMVDTYQSSGSGRSTTFRELNGLFRIDYILHTKDISSQDFVTLDSALSDHNAIFVRLNLD